MTTTSFPNGLGGVLGTSLAIGGPIYTTGTFTYVDFTSGLDASTGTNREQPKKTLGNAVASLSGLDNVIVLINNHTETLTADINISSVMVVGEGSAGGIPTATITLGAYRLISNSGSGSQLRGIKFVHAPGVLQAGIDISASGFHMEDCYVVGSGLGRALAMASAATSAKIINSTFIAATTGGVPASLMYSSAAITDLYMKGVTFSNGGTYCSSGFSLDFSSGAHVRLRIEELNLLLGADAKFNLSAGGYAKLGSMSNSARVDW